MPAANTDLVRNAAPNFATALANSMLVSDTTMTLQSVTGLPTGTAVTLTIDATDGSGNPTPTLKETVTGIVSGSTLTNLVRGLDGTTQQAHASGATVVQWFTANDWNDFQSSYLAQHTQLGAHSAVTGTSAVFTGNVTAANFIQSGGASANGWTTGLATPTTVTYNGNRSYTLVVNGTDLTGTISPGFRLRTTRTVAAPTQCTSLNGTTQYYSKTSPAGMTFTNNFVVSAWVKLSAYGLGYIASRFDGTNGWGLDVTGSGQVSLLGFNGGASNNCSVTSYQSLPLNKWVHIAAQLDMTSTTNSPTVNYIMIDGVDVPATVARSGTNPTALIQAGNLNIGAVNASSLFNGKIAQVAIYSAKVTEAAIQATISQGLAGTETSLISAYSFNNSINDLNANANNLTANGSAVATNADSPFGGQAGGSISSTLDYGIITSASFSTNTTLVVQVPEGCTIPTSGGVSAVSYSTQKVPYGMPINSDKWRVLYAYRQQTAVASNATFAAFTGMSFVVPIGAWSVGYDLGLYSISTTGVYWTLSSTSQSGLTSSTSDLNLQTLSQSPSAATVSMQAYNYAPINLSVATTYTMYTLGATTAAGILGTTTKCELFAEFTYL